MKATSAIGLLGSVIALAALAVIAAKPAVVANFFKGSGYLLGVAVSPATGSLPTYVG